MEPGHALYLLVAIATHCVLGYALARAAVGTAGAAGMAGALAPDVDLLTGPQWPAPFVHRGLTHTPLFAVVLVGAAYLLAGRRAAAAVGLGVTSHLVVDSLTASGIMWLYPLSDHSFGLAAGVHGPAPTLALWALAGGLVARARWTRGPERAGARPR